MPPGKWTIVLLKVTRSKGKGSEGKGEGEGKRRVGKGSKIEWRVCVGSAKEGT